MSDQPLNPMNDEICELCNEAKLTHRPDGACCVYNKSFAGFHPANRFTPRKEGRAVKVCLCIYCLKPVRAGAGNVCDDCDASTDHSVDANKMVPLDRLPFDLDKALKGIVPVKTRSGIYVASLRKSENVISGWIDGQRYIFGLDGTFLGSDRSLDLFLAGEEGKARPCKCGTIPSILQVHADGYIVQCPKCYTQTVDYLTKEIAVKIWNSNHAASPTPPETQHQPLASMLPTTQEELEAVKAANEVERKECCICGKPGDWTARGEQLKTLCDSCVDEGREVDLPKPEIETRRQAQAEVELPSNPKELADFQAWCKLQEGLAAQPKSEIDRQIEVMMASREGAIVERCHSGCEDEPTAIWSAHKPGERFNWQSFYYRIKPAETKPRVVWFIWDGSERLIGPFKCKQEIHPNWKQWPMDQEDLLSALKAAGIEAGGEV